MPHELNLHELAERALDRGLVTGADLAEAAGWTVGDRYEVQRVIGKGAAGTVFLVKDLKLGRPAALKLLDAAKSSERFLQEVQILAGLRHENVVSILDTGTHGARPYYVMDYSDGGTLAEADLPLEAWVQVLIKVCEASEAAHQQGIVHRDLKPENVLLGQRPLVADFGVAKLLYEEGQNSRRTQTGVLVGTPCYMAPEQLGAGDVGPWTDVHALGVMLYERLAGELPFTGKGLEVAVQILDATRPNAQSVNPAAHSGLSQVAQRAMAQDPTARYPSAAALAEALATALAQPTPRPPRYAAAVAAGLALTVTLVLALAWVGWGNGAPADPPPAEDTPPAAETDNTTASKEPATASEPTTPDEPAIWSTLDTAVEVTPTLLRAVKESLDEGSIEATLTRFNALARREVIESLDDAKLLSAVDPALSSPLARLKARLQQLPTGVPKLEALANATLLGARFVAFRYRQVDELSSAVHAPLLLGPEQASAHLTECLWWIYTLRLSKSMRSLHTAESAAKAVASLAAARRHGAPEHELEQAAALLERHR